MLANEWLRNGQPFTLVTPTPAPAEFDKQFSFPVVRLKEASQWKEIIRDCSLIFSDGFSIRYLGHWLLARKPVVFVHQTYLGPGRRWGWKHVFREWFRRLVCRLATHNIYISKAVADNVGLRNGTIIYNPVDPQFRPLAGIDVENDFAFFGRMWFGKGIDDIVRALHLCKQKGHNFTCDFYGDGPDLEATRAIARELGVLELVRFKGFAGESELVRAMNAAGVVLMPSRWPEPMGMVATEAMACGKCVIGTNAGGLGEVLEGYAPTVNNGNFQELAHEMIRVGCNPDIRRHYEGKALERAKAFEISKTVRRYNEVIRQALS